LELLHRELPQTHTVILAGDLHFGTSACYVKGWEAMLARVKKEKNTYLVLMGDLLEAIAVDDFRWHSEVHDPKVTPLMQAEALIEYLYPVRKKILACLTGNHEQKLWRFGDLTKMICERAELPFGGYSCKIEITNGGAGLYKIYATHGRLSVNSQADDPLRRLSNHRLSLKRKLQHLAGDAAVMACGHTHRLITVQPEAELYLTDDGSHIQAAYTKGVQHGSHIDVNLRWFANTGSFLKSTIVGACTYSEQAMYAPVMMGYPEIVCKGGVIQELKETRIG